MSISVKLYLKAFTLKGDIGLKRREQFLLPIEYTVGSSWTLRISEAEIFEIIIV
jgi:hypothetical protein